MIALYVSETETNRIRYASQLHLLKILDAKGFDLVMHWPQDRSVYYIWTSSKNSSQKSFLIHRMKGAQRIPDLKDVLEVKASLRTFPLTAAYNPPREKVLAPSPNGGSCRSLNDIAKWCDADIDIFTYYKVVIRK